MKRPRTTTLRRVACLIVLLLGGRAYSDEAVRVVVDCAKPIGEIRALNGVNNGPLDGGGLIDLGAAMGELSIPLVRLHDVHWPNADVVDLHVIFPNPQADPLKPQSYNFTRTDEYIASIVKLGPKIVYRLGESIEHTKQKKYVHPPADNAKWAAACIGIIRHYNEGWANGFHHGIQYWEIWNEPENRPAMWTGTEEQFYDLYATTARRLKESFPKLKIGGPAIGYVGDFKDEQLKPSAFLSAFFDRVKVANAPLDFFSWHCYSNDPTAPAKQAKLVRAMLDERGFTKTESHLNEWNYLPDMDWKPVTLEGQGLPRQRWYERQGGAEGAAFVAGVLMTLQDAPLDAANFYRADTGGFGLFTADGVPKRAFFAMKAFAQLQKSPLRLKVDAGDGAIACAGAERAEAGSPINVLISTQGNADRKINLAFERQHGSSKMDYELLRLDGEHEFENDGRGAIDPKAPTLSITTKGPSIVLVKLKPVSAK